MGGVCAWEALSDPSHSCVTTSTLHPPPTHTPIPPTHTPTPPTHTAPLRAVGPGICKVAGGGVHRRPPRRHDQGGAGERARKRLCCGLGSCTQERGAPQPWEKRLAPRRRPSPRPWPHPNRTHKTHTTCQHCRRAGCTRWWGACCLCRTTIARPRPRCSRRAASACASTPPPSARGGGWGVCMHGATRVLTRLPFLPLSHPPVPPNPPARPSQPARPPARPRLELRRGEDDRGPNVAVLVAYDELTRGDAFLCAWRSLPACPPAWSCACLPARLHAPHPPRTPTHPTHPPLIPPPHPPTHTPPMLAQTSRAAPPPTPIPCCWWRRTCGRRRRR